MEPLEISLIVLLIVFLLGVLFGLGLAKLNKLPSRFPDMFSSERFEFTDNVRLRFRAFQNRVFGGLGFVPKDSELTKLHNKLQKGGKISLLTTSLIEVLFALFYFVRCKPQPSSISTAQLL